MSSAFYSFLSSITNPITSRYDIKSQIATAGPWKIFLGIRKTTGTQVAVFIFEKKSLDTIFKRERGASKNDTEAVYELLKKEASNLARLRHPSVLQVVEPVTETRSSIAFATEPLMGPLPHLIRNSNSYGSDTTPTFELDELEIQKGLLQIGKGLQFFNDARVVHHNLTPDAVFVNAKGDWKIGGLGFSIFLNNTNETPNDSYFEVNDYLPEPCQINLDYTAPEFVMDNEITQANDMFALGCLAYAVHNQGQSLLQTFNNRRTYERKIQALSTMEFGKMPYHLQDVLRRLLTRYPSQRITAAEFQNSKYFDNILVSTMRFLESFAEKTREEKAQFMKGLSRVLGQFPERVLKRKILPSLLEELKNHQLLPYTIPNIFIIIQQLTPQEFCDLVLPSLKPVFLVRDPPQNMIVLLEKLDVLQQKTPREVFRDDVMPLVYAALETPTAMVQEKALRIVPLLAESLDYTTVKNSLFPRVQTLFVQTTVLSVKVSTLICFHSMIKVVDKFTMQEKLVPLLKNIKTKEPAVMLATLAVYDEMGKHLDKEIVATEILPQLWRMSFGPLLNLDQFRKFMRTIRELTNRVEEAHTRHLQEVKSLEDQTRSVSATPDSVKGAADIIVGDENTSFEALVQGKPATPQVGHLPSVMDAMNGPSQLTSGSGWSTASSSPAMRPLQPSSGTTQLRPSSPAVLQQPSSPGWTNTMLPTPTQAPKSSNTWSAANTFSDWTTPSSSPFMNQPALSTPSLPPPPSSSFANLTIQSKPSPNYSALHTLTSHHPSTPSTGMALLQPTTRSTATSTSSASQPVGHKLNNLNAFDPLG